MYFVNGSDVCVGVWHLCRSAFLEAIEIHHRSRLSLNTCTNEAFSKLEIFHTKSALQANKSEETARLRAEDRRSVESVTLYMTAVNGK